MSFLTSLAIILLSALLLGGLLCKIKLPPLIGMLLVGIAFSPRGLNFISVDILNISSDLRQLALIIILTRAGLSLKLDDLKKVGRPAVLLCFLPATFEIIGYVIFAPLVLRLSIRESALTGAVMGAVSPAVVVPRMLKLKEEGYGTNKSIPQMIIAGSSCDDVFVIVLFTALLTTVGAGGTGTGDFDFNIIWKIPASVVSGVILGILCGWVFAEMILFVLVGAEVDISYAASCGGSVITVLFCALVFRIAGVFACLIKTPLSREGSDCFRDVIG